MKWLNLVQWPTSTAGISLPKWCNPFCCNVFIHFFLRISNKLLLSATRKLVWSILFVSELNFINSTTKDVFHNTLSCKYVILAHVHSITLKILRTFLSAVNCQSILNVTCKHKNRAEKDVNTWISMALMDQDHELSDDLTEDKLHNHAT